MKNLITIDKDYILNRIKECEELPQFEYEKIAVKIYKEIISNSKSAEEVFDAAIETNIFHTPLNNLLKNRDIKYPTYQDYLNSL